MALGKVTFTLDPETVARIADSAKRIGIPKSQVVRQAIFDFHERGGRIGEEERQRRVRLFRRFLNRAPRRPASEIARELQEIRQGRRSGGRQGSLRPRG